MDAELRNRRAALRDRCRPLLRHGDVSPTEVLRDAADWCEAEGVAFDSYGTGDLLENFERKVRETLGFPAARFMPTGKVAQNIALKVWSGRAGNDHFGMHPTSHLELHEARAYEHLFGLRATLLGPRQSPLLAEHVAACHEPLAAVVTELPIREAGGQLPTWEQLEDLKALARERGFRLHLDGARLWETAAHFGRSYREICAGFDSVYVSFYKGIGGLAGAMLLGPEDFIEESKVWQVRAGAELVTMAPEVASAAMQFDRRLGLMPSYHARALELAEGLHATGRIQTLPRVPQANMMHVFLPWSAEASLRARDAVAEATGLWLFDGARPGDLPDTCRFEWYVGDAACAVPIEEITRAFASLADLADADAG